jgi:predicted transcriptional regulator
MRNDLKNQRTQLRLSQSALARLSGVARTKICLFELGDRPLKVSEDQLIEAALTKEAQRMQRSLATLGEAESAASKGKIVMN